MNLWISVDILLLFMQGLCKPDQIESQTNDFKAVNIYRTYHISLYFNISWSLKYEFLQIFLKYGGHAATLLVYIIFWGARAEDRTRGCLTAARRPTCGLRRHQGV